MPIKLINVNIMSQLTSRGLDNTSSAFVSDIHIYIHMIMTGDIFWERVIDYNFQDRITI